MDNLYLKQQLTAVSAGFFAFLSVGARLGIDEAFETQQIDAADLFLANVTFHGEHRRVAAGVALHTKFARALIQGAEYSWHSCSAAMRCVWRVLQAGKVP